MSLLVQAVIDEASSGGQVGPPGRIDAAVNAISVGHGQADAAFEREGRSG